MILRRTFLKICAGLGAFILPWTALPKSWGQKMDYLLGTPSVSLQLPSSVGKDSKRPSPEILGKKALTDIEALSHPNMQGRRAGTAGETRALVYIQEQLELLQLQTFGEDRYWQMFSIPSMQERLINGRALFRPDESDSLRVPAANILAGIKGKNNAETIIISAHYDHLGIYQQKLYAGSNDNASGVGCVLEVMRRLVSDSLQGEQPQLNIVAVFWSAEEMGFLGSKHFVKNPIIPLSQIKALINYDTVGNGQNKDFILWSTGDSPLVKQIEKTAEKNNAQVERVSPQGHHSDEVSFEHTGIPAVTMLSKEWLSKNHTPEDDISIINEEKLQTASNMLYDLVKEMAY